jgi:hypothetical protein
MSSADAVHCVVRKKYFSAELEDFMEDDSYVTAGK